MAWGKCAKCKKFVAKFSERFEDDGTRVLTASCHGQAATVRVKRSEREKYWDLTPVFFKAGSA